MNGLIIIDINGDPAKIAEEMGRDLVDPEGVQRLLNIINALILEVPHESLWSIEAGV